ncbi:hypothetical protein LUZ63_014907 [Rhynchospora breviuscula]|uniref:Protein ELC-like n=1 Tax=Rhynchospora breviuscula TaxID=2022672 RepID=A0A9Q0CBD0_9POAL|nr:hypothetical protein LUZ63_014907 [Rhynchospora breviuscula]
MAPSQEITALANQLMASDPFMYSNPLPALPYPYPGRHIIGNHLLSLSNSFPSFHAFPCPFVHNDGRSVTLIRIEGSILINNCTLALSIWLLETYPRAAPVVYLSPPKDMVLVPEYEYANSSTGMVSIPYLTNWGTSASSLADLVKEMEMLFSVYHPFCSEYDPRDDLILEIAKAISKDIYGNEMELKRLMQVQSVLEEKNNALMLHLGELEMERDTLEEQSEMEMMNINLMTSWLCENERRLKAVWTKGDGEIEELFQISDENGVFDNAIADRAIDDTIYALDKAVQEGCIPFDAYLKSIRSLSREQFFHRAVQRKQSQGGRARRSP